MNKTLTAAAVAVVVLAAVAGAYVMLSDDGEEELPVYHYTVDYVETYPSGYTWIRYTFEEEIERGTQIAIYVDGFLVDTLTLGNGHSFSSTIDVGLSNDYVLANATISILGAETIRTN